jgi:hypothetical protein
MLTAARDLVRRQGLASLQEVALKLGVPADVARALLQKWVEKGRIERLPIPTVCSGCTLCDSAPREVYQWCEDIAAVGTDGSLSDQSEAGNSVKVPKDCPAAGPPHSQR